MPFEPGATIRHYQILAPLGAGGMGVVFRARDTLLERFVAIKALPATLGQNPDRLNRFVREAKILASFNHPNIGAIYGLETIAPDETCLILELVEGDSLRHRLEQGALPIDEALRVCRAIAEALWDRLPAGTPGEIRELLARCLEKDVFRRLDRIESAVECLGAGQGKSRGNRESATTFRTR